MANATGRAASGPGPWAALAGIAFLLLFVAACGSGNGKQTLGAGTVATGTVEPTSVVPPAVGTVLPPTSRSAASGSTASPPQSAHATTTVATTSTTKARSNAPLTINVTVADVGAHTVRVHVVADDPDHTLPAISTWAPACSGWSVSFAAGDDLIACPAICLGSNNTPPPIAPGHVDATYDHKYAAAGTYRVKVSYVVPCGAPSFDPTISGAEASASIAIA